MAGQHRSPRSRALIFTVLAILVLLGAALGWAAYAATAAPPASSPRPSVTGSTPAGDAYRAKHPRPPAAQRPAQPHAAPVTQYVVISGDDLWDIAAAKCGAGQDWPALYAANRAVVGPDPTILRIGEHLQLTCRTTGGNP